MALDFKKRLPEWITQDKLYRLLIGFLGGSISADEIDIEHVLWELGSMVDAISTLTTDKNFSAHLLRSNQMTDLVGSNVNWAEVQARLESVRGQVDSLQGRINAHVYDLYSKEPLQAELENTWHPLLDEVKSANFDLVDIVTTNYDLVIEAALSTRSYLGVDLAFREGLWPGIRLEEWRAPDLSTGLLTKLHGSVDWRLGQGGTEVDPIIRRGQPEFDGDHAKRLILYPGFKGVPSREPFISFHEYFRRRVSTASHILFIGFAFRDGYINELVSSAITPDCRVAVLNPADSLPGQPFLSKAFHIKAGFGVAQRHKGDRLGGAPSFSPDSLRPWFANTEGPADLVAKPDF